MELYRIGVFWTAKIVRLACFKDSGSGVILTHLVRLPITTSVLTDVKEAVSHWAASHLPESAAVTAVITLPEGLLYLKEVGVPVGTKAEVTEAIRWELFTKNAAFPKDAILAWQYQPAPSGNPKVTAFALRGLDSDMYRGLFAGLHWNVAAIESSTTSVSRLMRTSAKPTLLLSFEGDQASIVIAEGHVAQFATLADVVQSEENSLAGHVTKAALTALVPKVRQAISFWEARSGKKISQIVLLGDDAGSSDARKLLHSSLELETVTPEPRTVKGIRFGKHKAQEIAEFASAIGAAMRLTSYTYEDDVNFLAPEFRREIAATTIKQQLMDGMWRMTKINVVLSLVCILIMLLSFFFRQQYARQITQNKRFIDNHPGQKLVPWVSETNSLTAQVSGLIKGQQDSGSKLAFFAVNTPTSLTFTSLKYESTPRASWTIEGTGPRASILAFYYQLQEKSPGAVISMPYSSLEREKDATFSITILW